MTKIEWTDEVWNPVNCAERYSVSSFGRVVGPSGKQLKPMISHSGHLYVFIDRKRRYIHRLVLESFIGNCPDGLECRHLDGNPHNNHVDNLAWGTKLENTNDRRLHGTMPIPHKSAWTKLKPENIPTIRFLSLSYSSRSIARIFGTSHTTIQKIIRGERWKGY